MLLRDHFCVFWERTPSLRDSPGGWKQGKARLGALGITGSLGHYPSSPMSLVTGTIQLEWSRPAPASLQYPARVSGG